MSFLGYLLGWKKKGMLFYHPETTNKKYKKEVFIFLCITIPLFFYWIFTNLANSNSNFNIDDCIQQCKEASKSETHAVILAPLSSSGRAHCVKLRTSEGCIIYSGLGIGLSKLVHLRMHDSISIEKGSSDVHIFRNGERIWSIRDLDNNCEKRCNNIKDSKSIFFIK